MTALDVSIRPFQAADRDAFRALNEEWISKYFGLEEQDHLLLGDPDRYILQPGGHIFMAFAGDQAVGCCALIPLEEPAVFELAKMAVSPAFRGGGIGRKILEHAIAQARTLRVKSLRLESNKRLADAVHLYESVGFVHRPPENLPSSPYRRANVFMELRLTDGHNLHHTIALLARFPAALNSLLRDLPETWTLRNEGENTWSAFDVVGHLAHLERTDWIPRVKRVLESGESKPFDPIDRWAQLRESEGKSLGALLDEFARLRYANLAELRALNLRPEDLERCGRHPALGVVTLSQLLAAWAAHDLSHLHQISRVMAYQYREAVGPWSKYLGVLQCAGHSSG